MHPAEKTGVVQFGEDTLQIGVAGKYLAFIGFNQPVMASAPNENRQQLVDWRSVGRAVRTRLATKFATSTPSTAKVHA